MDSSDKRDSIPGYRCARPYDGLSLAMTGCATLAHHKTICAQKLISSVRSS
ncbi:hypothetical protein ACQR1H_06805 [Bradyrhizobium sp. HKCCYLRH2015]|uniref:hypothetical protein n=1 Tax=unclassified Bradyrhizobium TaxID=2631580 RepID=UPI0029164A9C|nr:hypothetical protein [Bradyrhizobium sp. SZCCHNRI1009]